MRRGSLYRLIWLENHAGNPGALVFLLIISEPSNLFPIIRTVGLSFYDVFEPIARCHIVPLCVSSDIWHPWPSRRPQWLTIVPLIAVIWPGLISRVQGIVIFLGRRGELGVILAGVYFFYFSLTVGKMGWRVIGFGRVLGKREWIGLWVLLLGLGWIG